MTTHVSGTSQGVAFYASTEMIAALERAAAEHGVTRSHFARTQIAALLRAAGILDPQAPVTQHEARRKRLSNGRGRL